MKIYPSYRYHPDGRSIIVNNEDEDDELIGFFESPADFTEDAVEANKPVPAAEHEALKLDHQLLSDSLEAVKKDYAEFFNKVKGCKKFEDVKKILDEYEEE